MYGKIWVMAQGPLSMGAPIYALLQFNSVIQSMIFLAVAAIFVY